MSAKQASPVAPNPFVVARKRGVPIVAIESADPAATVKRCVESLNGKAEYTPILWWDCARGLRGVTPPGEAYAQEAGDQFVGVAHALLSALVSKPPKHPTPDGSKEVGGIVFIQNAQRFLDDREIVQAIWNCRDGLKGHGATLVLLSPAFNLPAELARDVVIISEPLPDAAHLGEIVDSICKDAELPNPEGEERDRVINTLLGLGTFEAEQVVSLSLTKEGIDKAALWERKVKAIEATPGLTVYKGKDKFSDVGGLENAKRETGQTIAGKMRISCLVLIDELDKAIAASTSDTSGTTQDQCKAMLSYMQDQEVLGMLWLGPPGVGKTQLAKAAANEYGIPLIMMDLGALKGSLVGQSEQNMRQALKVIHAVSDGRALFIGSCNRTETIPPELRRRFSYSLMFFDLPDREELGLSSGKSTKGSIWGVWRSKFDLSASQCDTVRDDGWTGSEVKNCCLKAWAQGIKLSEAAQTIVPVSRSAADMVQALRNSANGKYISASKPGFYTLTNTPSAPSGRKIGELS